MIFSFHNKLTVRASNKKYSFYNTLLSSTLQQLSTFGKINEYISIGNGLPNSESQNAFHLTSHIATAKLIFKSIQSDISKGSLFAKYQYKLQKSDVLATHITEVGLSNNETTPTIYNYFSLITDETPNGIDITNSDEILLEVTLNLTISENNQTILTSGNNPLIEFLLGNGLGDVYACSGSNFAENTRMNRQIPTNKEKYICTKTATIQNNSLKIDFECNLNIGELDEILFISADKVFARKNLKEHLTLSSETLNLTPKANYVIKIDSDIKSIVSVTKQSDQTVESNYFVSKYANSFGDEISLPFNNIFDSTTSRFLSKDGKFIFFVSNTKVYAYKNEDFKITEINTKEIVEDYITKIISFDKFVFIISKVAPYISTYIIEGNMIKSTSNNLKSFEKYSDFETIQQADVTWCNNGKFIIGLILNDSSALSIYLTYDDTNGFSTSSFLTNSREFNYIIAMYKNNFCDGRMIYLKEGETSLKCRLVTHSADGTETDVYSSLAYALVKDATNIYTKGRAIISEKSTTPSVVIYYYPQVYEYDLPLISTELKNYISQDMNYIIQKTETNEYKIYNLVGYDTPEEFSDGFLSILPYNQIVDFEFMKDSLLIFTNLSDKPVVAFNLKLNKTQIENLSDKDAEYLVAVEKYNKLGSDGKQIKFKLETKVNLWYFQTEFKRWLAAEMQHFLQVIATH